MIVTVAKREAAIAAISLLVAMAAGSLLMLLAGKSPIDVWLRMFEGTLESRAGYAQALFKATPFLFTGLAVWVALWVGLFNIGAESQVVAGMLACAVVGAALPAATPWPIAIPLCLLAAAAAGAALGALIGVLKVWRGAHEVIVSFMLNAIVAAAALYAGGAGLFVGETTRTRDIIGAAELPSLGVPGSALSLAAPLALVIAVAIAALRTRTRIGFTWRAVGASPEAARTAGIDVGRAIVGAMALSGALAGLAAAHYVLGYQHCYESGISLGAGFLGLAVALLGRSAGGIVAAALLFGVLSQGGLVVADQIPKDLIDVLVAVVILAVSATARLARRAREDGVGSPRARSASVASAGATPTPSGPDGAA